MAPERRLYGTSGGARTRPARIRPREKLTSRDGAARAEIKTDAYNSGIWYPLKILLNYIRARSAGIEEFEARVRPRIGKLKWFPWNTSLLFTRSGYHASRGRLFVHVNVCVCMCVAFLLFFTWKTRRRGGHLWVKLLSFCFFWLRVMLYFRHVLKINYTGSLVVAWNLEISILDGDKGTLAHTCEIITNQRCIKYSFNRNVFVSKSGNK